MANLFITEYAEQARDGQGYLMAAGQEPRVADQKVAIGGTSVQSSAFQPTTKLIMVHADVACHVAIGSNPTATDSMLRIPANGTLFFGVQAHPRTGDKIAVIEGV